MSLGYAENKTRRLQRAANHGIATVIAKDKAAFTSAIKNASLNYTTIIILQGSCITLRIDPVRAKREYEGRGNSTPFEVRYRSKLQKMAKVIRGASLDPFKWRI